jgi:AcrR family transcriptional regulator
MSIVSATNGPRGRGRPRDPALDAQILDAACGLLLEQGVHGFTLLEVARRAGVPKSTVYRRWPSRRDMLAAALAGLVERTVEPPNTGSFRGDLLASVKLQLEMLSGEARALVRLGLDVADDDELRPVVSEALDARRKNFYPVLQRAVARGELRPDIEFDAVLDLVFGAALSRVISQRDVSDDAVAEAIVDRAIRGLN